jgi:hypothetical protein
MPKVRKSPQKLFKAKVTRRSHAQDTLSGSTLTDCNSCSGEAIGKQKYADALGGRFVREVMHLMKTGEVFRLTTVVDPRRTDKIPQIETHENRRKTQSGR